VTAYQQSLQLGSVFHVQAVAKPGHTAEEVEAAIDAELARAGRRRPDGPRRWPPPANAIWSSGRHATGERRQLRRRRDRMNQYNQFLKNPG